MNLFYIFDEYTDIADGEGADQIRDIVVDAFRHPEKPRPEGELMLGEMAREFVSFLPFQSRHLTSLSLSSFWIRASNYVSPDDHCLPHFIHDFNTFTAAVVQEADDRAKRRHRPFLDYLSVRRNACGCLPSFALCEFGLNLPEEVYYHPRMVALREQGTDLVAVVNVRCVTFVHPEPVADNARSSANINRTSIPTPGKNLEVWNCTTLSNL